MIGVIFELEPNPIRKDTYFKTSNNLKPILETIEGFISIERFQSINEPNRFLSLSFWEDENAVKAWRNQSAHRKAQKMGRDNLFDNYRLRVVHVMRDYSKFERDQAPKDSCTLFS